MELLPLPPLPPLTAATEARLRRYGALLCRMNERVRLVGPRDEETLWRDHILDCLGVLPLLPARGRVADVGTGGGLPGAVLAVCRPDLEFVLADSLSRKTNALEAIAADLGLDNARVVCARSEDLAAAERESFAAAVVRGVAECGVIAEYLSPLVTPGGRLIAMKGAGDLAEELTPLAGRWGELGLSEPAVYEGGPGGRGGVLFVWEKAAPCPPVYPRRAGRAQKRPWWR